MAKAILWTPEKDALILEAREKLDSWDSIAAQLGLSRFVVLVRGRKINARMKPINSVTPKTSDRFPPLPAGSSVSWDAINEHTICLRGIAYSFQVFAHDRPSVLGGLR